jgi:hypothetical protein
MSDGMSTLTDEEKIKALQNMDNLLLHKQVQSAVARFVRDFRVKREGQKPLEESVEALSRKASRKSKSD